MTSIFRRMTIPQIIVLAYFTLISFGGLLLSLPIAAKSGTWTPYIDAVFTATSAVCVTGQITLNTAQHWTPFGKTVIITLIEIGGIGFMTIWMALFQLQGNQLGLRARKLLLESLNLSNSYGVQEILFYIIKFTLSVQAIGAFLLSWVWVPQLGWQKGILYSIFHSISAFNNAGFDLFGDSLIGYQNNSFVLLVIAFLIISGGLGFLVWRDLLTYRRNKKLLRYTKLSLHWVGVILATSFILFAISEGVNQTFKDLSFGDWLANIFFLSVTPRTAGYANIDYTSMSALGIFVTLILMFIGGNSGSTAGGAKVSTIAVVLTFLARTFRGKNMVLQHRTLSFQVIKQAFFIAFAGMFMVIVATMILLFTETIPAGFGIEYILMDVLSCFGTVGLTMGLTPNLTILGKIVLILLMFIGRVGLMTFFWSIGSHDKEAKIVYPEMTIMVG